VQEWVPVSAGESGAAVFRRSDGAAFAKRGPADALRAERDRVAWLAGTGLPGATVLDWRESGGAGWLVTSAVPGVPASELPPASWPAAIETLARVLRDLHSLPPASCPFSRRVAAMFAVAEDVVAHGAVNTDFLRPEHKAAPPPRLLDALRTRLPSIAEQESADLVVCHGDACLPNVLVDPDTLRCTGLIDLGRLGLADRYADLALACTQVDDEWPLSPPGSERVLAGYGLAGPDHDRLDFYLALDPLTWG
jgi:streptomycin 3"-kinase